MISSRSAVVELCRRYSNHPDLLNPLVSVLTKIKSGAADNGPAGLAVVCGRQPRVWRLAERLTEGDVATLLDAYRTGTPTRILAARYGVGTTSVKHLLRQHGVRRR
jgi:hypothetical protein